jgi:hypothetical protein
MEDDSFDEYLTVAPAPSRPTHGRRSNVRHPFLKGPIRVDWLVAAAGLGHRALRVALAVQYLRGLRKTDTFKMSNITARVWGVDSATKSRGLRKLAAAGLIAVKSHRGASPEVTVLPAPEA